MWLSTKLSLSSVKVLVTIVHLSFSMQLLLIIDVFTWANVHTEGEGERLVWYFDGSEEYMKGGHCTLAVVSLLLTVPLVLSYIFFLLFTKRLMKHYSFANKYLRPFYEAIHAPYKSSKEFFFTIRLLLLIVVYIVFATNRSSNPLCIYCVDCSFVIAVPCAASLVQTIQERCNTHH